MGISPNKNPPEFTWWIVCYIMDCIEILSQHGLLLSIDPRLSIVSEEFDINYYENNALLDIMQHLFVSKEYDYDDNNNNIMFCRLYFT